MEPKLKLGLYIILMMEGYYARGNDLCLTLSIDTWVATSMFSGNRNLCT